MSKKFILNKVSLSEAAFEYLIELNFLKIKNGDELNYDNRPFLIKDLNKMIKYYSNLEEYEKCQIILDFKNFKLNHDSRYI